jgi:hypothetical protein
MLLSGFGLVTTSWPTKCPLWSKTRQSPADQAISAATPGKSKSEFLNTQSCCNTAVSSTSNSHLRALEQRKLGRLPPTIRSRSVPRDVATRTKHSSSAERGERQTAAPSHLGRSTPLTPPTAAPKALKLSRRSNLYKVVRPIPRISAAFFWLPPTLTRTRCA